MAKAAAAAVYDPKDLKRFFLLGNLNAEELWPTINFVLLTWLLLALLPRWKHTPALTLLAPVYHSIVYVGGAISLLSSGDNDDVDFSTFAGVVKLFKDPNGVFIGWVHYVVFDALVGRTIVLDSISRGASVFPFHVCAVVPCLFLTLMVGPTGWLMYMVLRTIFLPPLPEVAQTKKKDE